MSEQSPRKAGRPRTGNIMKRKLVDGEYSY